MKYYIAYGSNLHKHQMKERCPGAVPYQTGTLKGWELIYRGLEPEKIYATIREKKEREIPVVIWSITSEHEKNLDEYEGYPTLYDKQWIEVTLQNGKTMIAMVYIMTEDALPGRPSDTYIQTIRQGYADFDLNLSVFETSLKTGCC